MKRCLVLIIIFSLVLPLLCVNSTYSYAQDDKEYLGDGFKVNVVVDSKWENGYSSTITIVDTGDNDINGWTLSFNSKDNIVDIWDANIIYHVDDMYVIEGEKWNCNVTTNKSVSFGYIANSGKEIDIPDFFCVDGGNVVISSKKCDVFFKVRDSWENEAVIDVSIQNKSNKPIKDWKLSFDAEYDIKDVWNAAIVQDIDGHYVLNNLKYNACINPNEIINIGYKIEGIAQSEKNVVINERIPKYCVNEDVDTENKDKGISINVSSYRVLTNTGYKLLVDAELVGYENDSDYMINIYSCDKSNRWNNCVTLSDCGDLSRTGDEIKNDGIHTGYLNVYEKEAGHLKFKVKVEKGSKCIESKDFEITVCEKLEDESFREYYRINSLLKEYLDNVLSNDKSNDIREIAEDIHVSFANFPISDIEVVNRFAIKLTYENGLTTYLQLSDNSNMEVMHRGGYYYPDIENELVKDEYEDDDVEIIGDDDTDDNDENNGLTQEYEYVQAKKVMLWSPFDSEWGDGDEKETVESMVQQSKLDLDLDVINDCKANVDSLRGIADYGLIILSTHGFKGEWFVTGEEYSDIYKYKEEICNSEISVLIHGDVNSAKTKMLYMVSPEWFSDNLDNTFSNSIVLNNSCDSLYTDELSNIFLDKGAKTYYGYTGSVTNDYVVTQTHCLLNGLLNEGLSTQEAYDYSYDEYFGGSFLAVRGYGNIAISGHLINGGFESGVKGWNVKGDGRSISKLGNVLPIEGERMGIISTGLGYTKEMGQLNQSIEVPYDASKLSFSWNFISEEFLEYIGSEYNDPFEASLIIKDEENINHKLLSMDVNSIAREFEASKKSEGKLICASPNIVFDKGDVWMTGWQNAYVDISEYAGKDVQLIFSVRDAKDTEYTTAVLIDNVAFDSGNIESGDSIKISSAFSDKTIRGLFKSNDKSKSYVLYDSENFSSQAKMERKIIKYTYGYKKLSQVKMCDIKTEKEFIDCWDNIDTNQVDRVSLLFHGTFYAIMIDADNNENLTTNPYNKVSSEVHATYIRNLPKKKIRMINILTCNGGVLDAINYNDTISIKDENGIKHTFGIKGNVAQAFIDSQDVEEVQAWDGSLSYTLGLPRLSKNQEHFRNKLKVLNKKRETKPIRGVIVEDISKRKKYNRGSHKPKGMIKYSKNKSGEYICKYKYTYQLKSYSFTYSKIKSKKIVLRELS